MIIKHEERWDRFFQKSEITPFKVYYEDFADSYEDIAIKILKYIGIPVPENLVFGDRKLVKLSDDLSEKWVRKYSEIYEKHGDHPDIIGLSEIPENSRVWLYGAGRSGDNAYRFIKKHRKDIEIVGYIDSFKSGKLNDLEIIRIEDFKPCSDRILITSQFCDQISDILRKKGISEYKIVDFGYFYV